MMMMMIIIIVVVVVVTINKFQIYTPNNNSIKRYYLLLQSLLSQLKHIPHKDWNEMDKLLPDLQS